MSPSKKALFKRSSENFFEQIFAIREVQIGRKNENLEGRKDYFYL